jgi:hypothetical protein
MTECASDFNWIISPTSPLIRDTLPSRSFICTMMSALRRAVVSNRHAFRWTGASLGRDTAWKALRRRSMQGVCLPGGATAAKCTGGRLAGWRNCLFTSAERFCFAAAQQAIELA